MSGFVALTNGTNYVEENAVRFGLSLEVAARPAFLNEVNPYNAMLYRAVLAVGKVTVHEHRYTMLPWKCDIFHVHWPEVVPRSASPKEWIRTIREWLWLLVARAAGVKIVWTAHNPFPHDMEQSRLNRFLWRQFLALLDGVIFPSEESRTIVTANYPALRLIPSALIKIGHYRPWIDTIRRAGIAPSPDVEIALESLGAAFTVLNFGQIRPYKNVDELMREFSAVEDPTIRLLVAGGCRDASYLAKLQGLAKADERIVLLAKHLDDASLVACLDRADLVVLPFQKILNSSSALTALSFGKHVVVPGIGSMMSLQQDVGEGALTLYEGAFGADILLAAIDQVRSGNVVLPDLHDYDWPSIGVQTSDYYYRLIGS